MIAAIEQQRVINMGIYGTPFPSGFDRAMYDYQKDLSINPWGANPSVRDQPYSSQVRRELLDGSSVNMANEYYDRTAEIDRRSHFLGPLLDRNFVDRMTGGVNCDLLRRATELHDPLAIGNLRETVDRAATARIAEHWKFGSAPSWSLGRSCWSI
jgi:hypothetical protein